MRAVEIAERESPALHREDPLERAVEILVAQRLPSVAVVDDDGTMLGAVTDWSLARLALPAYAEALGDLGVVPEDFDPMEHRLADAATLPVGRVMSTDFARADETTSLVEAVWIMLQSRSRRLYILRGKLLVGALSLERALREMVAPEHEAEPDPAPSRR